MSDFYFGFLLGNGFALCAISVLWALCEDYHQWRKRREAAKNVPWITVDPIPQKPARRPVKKAARKPRK